MTEESLKPPPEGDADANATAAINDHSKDRRGAKRENRKAPEDLYDLTQPIPKMTQPDKTAHEKEVDLIQLAIEALKREKEALQSKVDAASNPSSNRNTAAGSEREIIQQLKAKKSVLLDEKKALRKRLDDSKLLLDKLLNDRKAAKVHVRFDSLAKIDEEIARLKRLQQTTNMSLPDEKKLIKEIDTLQSSKKMFADLDANQNQMNATRELTKSLSDDIKSKDVHINSLQREIEERQKTLQSMGDFEKEAKTSRKMLIDEREKVKKTIADKYKELDQVREKFRLDTDKWFDYQRALKAQDKMRKEEERKKREEEQLAWLKKKEEEELKKTPYEEEMYLCDFLADYLSRTYLTNKEEKKTPSDQEMTTPAFSSSSSSSSSTLQDNPFANLKPANKRTDDVFLQMGKAKQTRPRTIESKKTKATVTPVPFTLSIDIFEQFGWVHLNPPMSLEGVEKSVQELKNQKIWYSQQPRGTVVTAKEMRKAKDKATKNDSGLDSLATGASSSAGGGGGGGGSKSQGTRKGFDLSSDEQFVPLTSSMTMTTTMDSSSWGDDKGKGK